nr:elongation of very long chain fatty acids protein 6 [Apocyclops royi]
MASLNTLSMSNNLLLAPNYSYIFDFERDFEHTEARRWMLANWRAVCSYAAGLYLLLIFAGQQIMASRPRFEMRGPLVFWNTFLALFSIMGACRTIPEFVYVLSTHGIYHSVCIPSFIENDRVSGFWALMFVLSKVPELGDTIFIVLRKQPLIFLHWYHHLTVLLYAWYSFTEYTAAARWFIVMNYLVHSVMYTYYAFKAMKFRVPRGIAMVITTLQLIQMVFGCLVNVWAYQIKEAGQECGVSHQNINLSLLMYTSYFVLFARFFYNTYLANDSGTKKPLPAKPAQDSKKKN